MSVTPQQERILEIHRDLGWHCSTEYEYIRDHRKRISELNNGYLKEKGYHLIGRQCDGRCGKNHSSTLFMRRAIRYERGSALYSAKQPVNAPRTHETPQDREYYITLGKELVSAFNHA